ncbi:DNA-directed RNA polymerase i subunit [Colletotrichum camelliae]|nr:DNA-directed RNA polymerase i subunit [Colletotrichum camelliae]
MGGKSDGRRSGGFQRRDRTPIKREIKQEIVDDDGKSFLRACSPATPSFSRSPKAFGSGSGAPTTQAQAHRPATANAPLVRATPTRISEASQKIPVALKSKSPITPSKKVTFAPRPIFEPSPGTMAPRKLDGVHSLNALLEAGSKEPAQTKGKFTKTAKPKADKKFDPRADDSDSESSSDASDSDDEPSPDFLASINGHVSPKKSADTPLKKAKRGKDDEVADSDVERTASSAKANATKKKPTRPESSSEDESSSAEAEEQSDSDSDSSDSDSESNKKPAQKVTAKAIEKAASSSSESESESESEDEETSKPAAKPTAKPAAKPAVNGTKATKAASTSSSDSSSEEESSDKESSSEEEESSSDKDGSSDSESDDEADEPAAVVSQRTGKELSVPGFVGKDFILRKAQGDEDGKDMADFFTKAKLDGKQLWYFTAPASVPINVIEKLEIPMDKVKKGQPIFKHNSEDYTVGQDEGSTSIQLLIPNKKGARYESAPHKVDNVLHFKRVTQLPGGDPRVNTRAIEPSAVRPQPPNLTARFRPIGVTDDTPMGNIGVDASSDESDVEMTAAPAVSTSKKSKPAAKSQDAMDIDEPTPKAKKSSKKEKKSKTASEPTQNSQSTIIEVPNSQPLTSKKEKKSNKKRRDSIESISSVGSNPKPEPKKAAATPKSSKRKHSSEDDQDSASAQLEQETLSAEKKAKKAKTETAILPPTIPKAGFSFSSLGNSPAPTSTPQSTKSKSSKKAKETPIQPPKRQSIVPIPTPGVKMASPAATETPKEKTKRKSKSDKKETPVPAPKY